MSGEDLRSTRDTGRKERNPVASGIFAEPSSPRDEVGCKKKDFGCTILYFLWNLMIYLWGVLRHQLYIFYLVIINI